MLTLPAGLLPTPTLAQIRRRRHFGRFQRSSVPIIRDAQRAIMRATRNTRTMSLNKLAFHARVDRHLVLRVLANTGMPEILKLDAILRVTGHCLTIEPLRSEDD